MKVLFVIPGHSTERSMPFARKQAEAVQVLGAETKTFFLSGRTHPFKLLQELRRFRKESKEFSPDIVHAQFGTITSMFSALTLTRPLVITYRGSDLNPVNNAHPLRTLLGHAMSQIASLKADQVICVSKELANRLICRRDKITILPTGVDVDVFSPKDQAAARRILGWGDHEKIVLFNAGREPTIKRLDLALNALQHAKSEITNLRFELLDGTLTQQDVALRMNAANCLLLTSDFEGSPTVIQEAMACNLPVVSVDVGDVRERLQEVTPSRIVARNPKMIGDALVEIVKMNLRSNGREVVHLISQSSIAEKTLDLYRSCLR